MPRMASAGATVLRPTPISTATRCDHGELGNGSSGVADSDGEQFATATMAEVEPKRKGDDQGNRKGDSRHLEVLEH